MAIWEKKELDDYDYEHCCCTNCGKPTICVPIFDDDYDAVQIGVGEYLTPYCPNCGAKMNVPEIIRKDWRDEEF